MNRTIRVFLHTTLWGVIWLITYLLTDTDTEFINKNWPVFLMQIISISALIYFAAPTLLFKKKHMLFAIVSIGIIVLCTGIISYNTTNKPQPSFDRPPVERPYIENPPPRHKNNAVRQRPQGPPLAPPQFFIHFFVLGFTYVMATFLETFLFARKKEEETILNQQENLQTELKFLKSQINPHFLFNSLNNIYALSVIDSDKTQQSISHLSDMLRYVLYECEQELVPLEKEITYIKNYVKLFSLKSSKPYAIEMDFDMHQQHHKIAPMLLIPFVENALKHGNIEAKSDSYIRMGIKSDATSIQFKIENSISEVKKVVDKVGGIGLENVKKRLEIIYPKQHHLAIDHTTKSFSVTLKINLNGND